MWWLEGRNGRGREGMGESILQWDQSISIATAGPGIIFLALSRGAPVYAPSATFDDGSEDGSAKPSVVPAAAVCERFFPPKVPPAARDWAALFPPEVDITCCSSTRRPMRWAAHPCTLVCSCSKMAASPRPLGKRT